ncbi:MAG: rRNA maturation RNase YbeY [Candidatus Taylorbacteria bacterium]|nr:rRNA maturation RNase YbeY [Candidatus Taylorbacteria bacterium]
MKTEPTFTLTNVTKAKLPRLAFADMKDAILGPDYTLDFSIVDTETIHHLNRTTRGIDAPTDILSFPLSDTEGEIYLNPEYTEIEAKKFDRDYDNFVGFLFIHGLVHLKGFDHGSTMERIEAKFRKQFGI